MFSRYIALVLLFHISLNGNAKFSQATDSSEADKVRKISSAKKYLAELDGGTLIDDDELFNSQNSAENQARKILRAKQYLDQLDDARVETWIDPYDMLNYQASSTDAIIKAGLQKNAGERKYQKNNNIKVSAADSELPENKQFVNVLSSSPSDEREIPCTNDVQEKELTEYDYVYLNRWLKIFLKKVNVNSDMKMEEIRFVQFAVTNRELFTLQDMLDFKSQDVSTVDKIVSKIVADVHILSSKSSWWHITIEFVTSEKFLFSGAIILCLIFLFYLYHCFLNHPIRTFIILVFLTSFIMSWYSLYQKKVAEKFATLDSLDFSTECRKENLGYAAYFSVLIKSAFFNLGDDCEKYYKAQMVDPVYSVSPITAISDTFANMVLQPLGPMGNHLNAFIKEFFSGIPYIAIIPGIIFSILVLLIVCRYKIRFPFLLASLEPSMPTYDFNRIDDVPQNETDRNNRCPIMQVSQLHIHMGKDNASVETDQLQLHDLCQRESNAEESTLFSQNAEKSTKVSQQKICKSTNDATINAKEFGISSSGDNTDVIGVNKTDSCLLNSNECGDCLRETLETVEDKSHEQFIEHVKS